MKTGSSLLCLQDPLLVHTLSQTNPPTPSRPVLKIHYQVIRLLQVKQRGFVCIVNVIRMSNTTDNFVCSSQTACCMFIMKSDDVLWAETINYLHVSCFCFR